MQLVLSLIFIFFLNIIFSSPSSCNAYHFILYLHQWLLLNSELLLHLSSFWYPSIDLHFFHQAFIWAYPKYFQALIPILYFQIHLLTLTLTIGSQLLTSASVLLLVINLNLYRIFIVFSYSYKPHLDQFLLPTIFSLNAGL